MHITFLGCGAWGYALAYLLAEKGNSITCWTVDTALEGASIHPRHPDYPIPSNMRITTQAKQALKDADIVIESVTAAGLRPVLNEIGSLIPKNALFILTSKGIEQKSGLTLSEVVMEILGAEWKEQLAALSGPSFAKEVIAKQPTSVVAAAYIPLIAKETALLFTTPYFRVYPNTDMHGVSFCGALKNIIAIACGIAEGMGYGMGTRAALMTRGLHEMNKLARVEGCRTETLSGLAGMGDLFLTGSSTLSRNFVFGQLLAQGKTPDEAKEKIGMVVEGAYTCFSARELANKLNVAMPITDLICQLIEGKILPQDGVRLLMEREVKEEHL